MYHVTAFVMMARNMKGVVCFLTLSMVASFPSEDVVILKPNEFHSAIKENNHFVLFCRPKHTNCELLTPIWDDLDRLYGHDDTAVTLAQVDCSVEKKFCEEQNVKIVPVLRFFYKSPAEFKDFRGKRSFEHLHRFAEEEIHRADNVTVSGLPDAVIELEADRFKDFVSEKLHFVKFYTPWCASCKLFAPVWHDLAMEVGGSLDLFISQVDCSQASAVCAEYGIKAFPSLVVFFNGTKVDKYEGTKVLEDLRQYIEDKEEEYEHKQHHNVAVQYENRIALLTEDSFTHVVKNHLVFVNFYTPWCERCKELKPVWEQLAETNQNRSLVFASMDCDEHNHVCESHSVTIYPTLILYQEGLHLIDYDENQTAVDLQKFIDIFTLLEHDEL